MLRILILGADGYYGYPLFERLRKNHEVIGLDNFVRRNYDWAPSLTPIGERDVEFCDVLDYNLLRLTFEEFRPDVVIHLAEQRSAPFSMRDYEGKRDTIQTNVMGTMNILECAKEFSTKVIHIGSMGVYGYENERFINEGDAVRQPGSIYHLSKEMDSSLFAFYARMYGVDSVDLNQGTVWGIGGRFDYDEIYGTVINRFIVQSIIDCPLTIYGTGEQQRSFIHIDNSIDCIELVLAKGWTRYEVYNQFTEILTVNEIATVIGTEVEYLDNPRIEKQANRLESTNQKLLTLGLTPILFDKEQVTKIQQSIMPYIGLAEIDLIYPNGTWT